MTERIEKLVELVLRGALFPQITPVEYDREDLLLPPVARSAKRLREYLLAQEPILNDSTWSKSGAKSAPQGFANLLLPSLAAVLERFANTVRSLPRDRVKSIAERDWILSMI